MRHPKLGQQYLAPRQQDRPMYFACIHIPDFIVQAVVRGEPALRRQAVAILDGAAPLLKVVALNPKARQAGLELGMTKLQAAQYPSIEIRQRSPAQEATAHAALKDCAAAFSPGVEDTAADTVVLDLAGLERLFCSPEEIASRIARCAWELGLEAQIALAANLEAAVHAALGFPGITLIPPGEEAERLGGLPVEVLAPAQEMLGTLQRWGVRRFRELAALPTLPLS